MLYEMSIAYFPAVITAAVPEPSKTGGPRSPKSRCWRKDSESEYHPPPPSPYS